MVEGEPSDSSSVVWPVHAELRVEPQLFATEGSRIDDSPLQTTRLRVLVVDDDRDAACMLNMAVTGRGANLAAGKHVVTDASLDPARPRAEGSIRALPWS